MYLPKHKNILTLLLTLALAMGLSSVSFTQEEVPEEALPVEDEADLKEDVVDGNSISDDDDVEISGDLDVEEVVEENDRPELDGNEIGQERERQVEDYNQAAAVQQQLEQNEPAEEAEEAQAAVADEGANGTEVQLDPQSYALGVALAANVVNTYEPLDLDYRAFGEGFEAALSGEDLALSEERIAQYVRAARQQLRQNSRAGGGGSDQAAANLEKGRAFLEQNAQREGVKVTESGLQYVVLEEGEGESPDPTDRVRVNYTGTLLDGQVFDSTENRGPAVFGVNQVIPGWTEALGMMKEGGKWRLFIPSDLAYGPRGAGGRIGPNEVLIFEVELLDVMN